MDNLADMLLDIINYLESLNVVDGDGVDTFRDNMPESPDKAISLIEYDGLGAIPSAEGVVRRFQVGARSSADDPDWAHSKVWSIFNALVTDELVIDTRELVPAGDFWGVLRGVQTPHKTKTDESNRVTYSFNVIVTTYRD